MLSRDQPESVVGWPVMLHDVASLDRSTRIALIGTNTSPAGARGTVVLTALRVGAINPPVAFVGPLDGSSGDR